MCTIEHIMIVLNCLCCIKIVSEKRFSETELKESMTKTPPTKSPPTIFWRQKTQIAEFGQNSLICYLGACFRFQSVNFEARIFIFR